MTTENPTPEQVSEMSLIEKKRFWNRRWSIKSSEHLREYRRNYYQKNREKIIEKSMARYRSNPSESNKKSAERARKNPIKTREKFSKYRKENRIKILANQLEWRNRNRGKWVYFSSRRRAVIRNSTVNPAGISEWMQRMRSLSFVKCYYCRRLFHACEIHFDHVIPISRGGPHSIENLCVSCPGCNLSKGPNLISEWDSKPELIFDL